MPTSAAAVARSPLAAWHAAHGAQLAEREGWLTPLHYGDAAREAQTARGGLGVADISAAAKCSFRGPAVADLAARLAGESGKLAPRCSLTVLAGAAIAYRLAPDHLLVIGASGTAARSLADLGAGLPLVTSDVTSQLAGIALVGPGLDPTLHQLAQCDLRPSVLPPGACAETALASVEALLARPAAEPMPVLRIYVAWDVAEYVWERIFETAPERNTTPLGSDALRALGVT